MFGLSQVNIHRFIFWSKKIKRIFQNIAKISCMSRTYEAKNCFNKTTLITFFFDSPCTFKDLKELFINFA